MKSFLLYSFFAVVGLLMICIWLFESIHFGRKHMRESSSFNAMAAKNLRYIGRMIVALTILALGCGLAYRSLP